MARPKKNTKAGKIANQKWKETMAKKYGSASEKMREIGRIGGQNGKGPNYKGGFAADNERAKIAGAKGGSISRRKSKYHQTFEDNRKAIETTIMSTATLKDLSKSLGVPYASLINYVRKYIYKEGK